MPDIDSYTGTSLTAREFQRLSEQGDIRNHVSFDMAWLDGATDVTTAFASAVASVRATAIDSTHRPQLILPPGKYKLSDTVDCNKVAIWAPEGAMILAEAVGTGKAALSWAQGTEDQWFGSNPPCLKNVYILGRDTPVQSPTYTVGAFAIQTGAPWLRFEQVTLRNFDKPVKWGAFDYLHTWKHCWFMSCNYGIWWGASKSVAGERMVWIDCNISNNTHGFYFNHNTDTNADGIGDGLGSGGSFYILDSAIDYNVTTSGTVVGPGSSPNDHPWQLTISGGHQETLIATSGSANRFINGGTLHFKGVNIYDDYTKPITTSFYGRTNIASTHFDIPGNIVWCEGNGLYRAHGNTQRYGGNVLITSTLVDYANPVHMGRVFTPRNAAYTLVLDDAQTILVHESADTTARTWTIPANTTVAYPIGTELHFLNENGAGVISIAITTNTMRLSPGGTTGTRTLAANGRAIAIKHDAVTWQISGSGLT